MLFMNTVEIDWAVDSYKQHPILSLATKLLADLRDIVDGNSDGWAYWPAPVRSARQLQELIQNGRNNPAAVTEEAFAKAMIPIKSFYTRFKSKMPNGEPLVFPSPPKPMNLRKRPMPGVRRRR